MKWKSNICILILMILLGAAWVLALPEGPDRAISVVETSRKTVSPNKTLSVLAGNVTQITVTGSLSTTSWAGYYGNVSGRLTLETSAGDIMYDWDIANPKGEIYATESPILPAWGQPGQESKIECWNYTKGKSTYYIHYSEIEGWDTTVGDAGEVQRFAEKGIKADAVDSINNTFLRTSSRAFPGFWVGTKYINGSSNIMKCPSVATYNSSGPKNSTYGTGVLDWSADTGSKAGGNYQEVILFDNTSRSILFTAIIDFERDMTGFDGRVWDFQMIVPENGNGGDTATTTYHFYVELE